MKQLYTHGGRRPGSGRPTTDRTIPVMVRVSPEAAKMLEGVKNKSEFIDSLIISNNKQNHIKL